jgi:hypothetical protein
MNQFLTLFGPTVALLSAVWFWRLQVVGKRRLEVAEEAILLFDKIKSIIMLIRLRPVADSDLQRFLQTISELREKNETFSQIRRIKILSKYYVGNDAEQSFGMLETIIVELMSAAASGAYSDRSPTSRSMEESAAILWGHDPDPVEERLLIAEAQLESACRAVIAAGTNLIWPFRQRSVRKHASRKS